MVKLEVTLLDKILSKGLLGRRQIGRATKWNIVNKQGSRGVLEAMYKPRSTLEQYFGKVVHSCLPFLSFFTYRFHVERARASGVRLEDHYYHKFFREPYITWHIYAQNFHPSTLNDRIRSVHFYRKTKTLFKGFTVPDWAQGQKMDGYDVDVHYSRKEWTPMPFSGERLDPNMLNWFRFEQIGKGFSSRLFYNEVHKPTWHRHGGHLDNPEKTLHSFKYGDQEHEDSLGFDVSTKAGRDALAAEVQRWKQMTPELYEAHGFDENTGKQKNRYISTEPHFQRALTHYRTYVMQQKIEGAVEAGKLTQEEVNAGRAFFDERGLPAANLLLLGQKGLLGDESGYSALLHILHATGLGDFEHNPTTSMPVEEQFLQYFDNKYDITEKGLTEALPLIITDERDRSRVQALIESGHASEALPKEKHHHLA